MTAVRLDAAIDILLDALAERLAAKVVERIGAGTPAAYTSDPRKLNLPPGWSKRQWDDAGRLADGDASRPPLRKDPRGYSCPVASFDAWAGAQTRRKRKRVVPETPQQWRERQLAAMGLLRSRR